MVDQAGSIDISFNLITRGDVQGIPLVEMGTEDFTRPITTGITANFITARAAARQMIEQGSGVILALDSGSANGSPMMGGTGPADGATDAFIRNLAAEIGPRGVRVVGILTAGLPETFTGENLAAVDSRFHDEAPFQGSLRVWMRMTRRSPRLAEVAATAAFLVSEKARGVPAREPLRDRGRAYFVVDGQPPRLRRRVDSRRGDAIPHPVAGGPKARRNRRRTARA